jgi:octaprenyl-diphosphate synthase
LFSDKSNELIQECVTVLELATESRLHSHVPLVQQVANYTINSGGKRLRPLMLILGAKSVGCSSIKVVDMAVALEFVHTATLLHDDVVDDSKVRRGESTANVQFGNAASVLVGDFLYSRAFQIMVDVGIDAVFKIMADATNDISEGEVLQLANIKNINLGEEEYFQVIRAKTSKLFEAATTLGGVIAGADADTVDDLGNYGACVGTAFQIVDDILDYVGVEGVIGKKVGDDLREGKVTLPVIHALREGTVSDREMISDLLGNENESTPEKTLQIFDRLGSLEYARGCARKEVTQAVDSLSSLSPSSAKECLVELAVSSLDRIK